MVFLTVLFLFIVTINGYCQDKQFDTTKWIGLKTDLQTRTATIIRFQVSIMRSKGIDKKEWAQLGLHAANLSKHLDTVTTINSAAIKTTTKINSSLTKALGQIIMQLMKNDQKTVKESAEITANMEAIEKQLIITKQLYNKACEESNRPDLVFDEKTSASQPVGLGS